MALGTAATMALGTVGGSLIQGNAANRAADAQADAADQANETQRYIYNRNVQLSEPWRNVGRNALFALAGEAGLSTGAAQPGGEAGNNLTGPAAISQNTTLVDENYQPRRYDPRQEQWTGGPQFQTTYSVGDQSFDTRSAAQDYTQSQPANTPAPQDLPSFETSPGYEFRREQGEQAIERMAAARGLRLSGATMQDAARFNQGLASQEYGNYWNRLAGLAGAGQTATQNTQMMGQNFANAVGQNARAAGAARASGYQGTANAISGGINALGGIYGSAASGALGPNPGLGITPSPAGLRAWGWNQ